MTPSERFDRRLPEILEEISQPRTPDYFDDLLGQTAHMRQRPAWTLPERWLPMVDITRQPAFSRQVPWRQLAVLALIVVLLAAGLVLVIGSRPRVPAPFGLARNGLVAYAQAGDIYTADPATGADKAVVTGPETDLRPVFSLDGTRFAFERKVGGSSGPGLLFVAHADGSGLAQVTPEPVGFINNYAFSPDGQEILVSTGPEGMRAILVAKTDGSATRTLDVGSLVEAIDPIYRAPDGREVIFVGTEPGQSAAGLYAVNPDGTGLRPIVAPTNMLMLGPRSSPDGTQIAYDAIRADYETNPSSPLVRVFIVAGDGGTPRILRDFPDINDSEVVVAWSNDGSRLLVSSCHYSEPGVTDCPSTMAVVPIGGGPEVRIDIPKGFPGADGTVQVWAPDDGAILTTPLGPDGLPRGDALSWDPLTGRSTTVPWNGAGGPSWQRLAP